MKLLCEVPLNVDEYASSQFKWLHSNDDNNFLFTFEHQKRMRIFNIKHKNTRSQQLAARQAAQAQAGTPGAGAPSAQEAQSASLAEPRKCTSLAWNWDESLLALVVDKRQIYLWEVKRNNFVHFKPKFMQQQQQQQQFQQQPFQQQQQQRQNTSQNRRASPGSTKIDQRRSTKEIEHVVWSKLCNKLAICYSSGQILLCQVAALQQFAGNPSGDTSPSSSQQQQQQQQQPVQHVTIWEKFVDNSDSVLKRILSVQASDSADLFACTSVISELLVMTFDGETKFYCQSEGDDIRPHNIKFSPLIREYNERTGTYCEQTLWLAYQTGTNGLFVKKIAVSPSSPPGGLTGNGDSFYDLPPKLGILLYDDEVAAASAAAAAATSSTVSEPASAPEVAHEGDSLQQAAAAAAASSFAAPAAIVVDFYWLNSTRLLACLSSGVIHLVQVNTNALHQQHHAYNQSAAYSTVVQPFNSTPEVGGGALAARFMQSYLISTEVLRIKLNEGNCDDTDSDKYHDSSKSTSNSSSNSGVSFKIFELIKKQNGRSSCTPLGTNSEQRRQCFALAAGTNYEMFYYEIYETGGAGSLGDLSFEQFDQVDFGPSLARHSGLELARLKWSQDCALLSVQLTSGHLLVYRAQLQNYMAASYWAKTAYLSGANEITLLNYSLDSGGQAMNLPQAQQQLSSPGQEEAPTSGRQSSLSNQSNSLGGAERAITLNVHFEPSLLAIGPRHLALALNNRVRFYSIDSIHNTTRNASSPDAISSSRLHEQQQQEAAAAYGSSSADCGEQEYVTIVVGVSLSSRFVAVLLDDGRLKLHSLKLLRADANYCASPCSANSTISSAGRDYRTSNSDDTDDDDDDDEGGGYGVDVNDERFFPDPSQPERIAAFTLTEQLLVYCTHERQINLFSLETWTIVQVCDHSSLFAGPVRKLKPNERGNKFMCLLDLATSESTIKKNAARAANNSDLYKKFTLNTYDADDDANNVYLYDVYWNDVFPVASLTQRLNLHNNNSNNKQVTTAKDLLDKQFQVTLNQLAAPAAAVSRESIEEARRFLVDSQAEAYDLRLNKINDAIWDTDGRTILLIELNSIHVFAVLDHTLEQEAPIVQYAASAKKPSSYTTLYVSQGIVSYQTSLGRVINSILETHDDELKLTRLEFKIKQLKDTYSDLIASEFATLQAQQQSSSHHQINDEENRTKRLTGTTNKLGNQQERLSPLLETQLKIIALKLNYLSTILPIYSLAKCRDICEHLMDDQAFNLAVESNQPDWLSSLDQLVWRRLAVWSIYTLNLNFACDIYRQHKLVSEADQLAKLIDDIQAKGLDSKETIRDRLLLIIGQIGVPN